MNPGSTEAQSVIKNEETYAASVLSLNTAKQEAQGGPMIDRTGQTHTKFELHDVTRLLTLAH